MTAEQRRRGALEAIERILNRGGDADDVLREVVHVLSRLYRYVEIRFVERGELVLGPSAGDPDAGSSQSWPVSFEGHMVAELHLAAAGADDQAFLDRVAILISPYCLVGWDTGGLRWSP
jgi:hypothetical protein